MTYEYFKKNNDISKRTNPAVGRVSHVNFKRNTCTLVYEDNISEVPIKELVDEIVLDGMGSISNPSILKNWKGWTT